MYELSYQSLILFFADQSPVCPAKEQRSSAFAVPAVLLGYAGSVFGGETYLD